MARNSMLFSVNVVPMCIFLGCDGEMTKKTGLRIWLLNLIRTSLKSNCGGGSAQFDKSTKLWRQWLASSYSGLIERGLPFHLKLQNSWPFFRANVIRCTEWIDGSGIPRLGFAFDLLLTHLNIEECHLFSIGQVKFLWTLKPTFTRNFKALYSLKTEALVGSSISYRECVSSHFSTRFV